MNNFGVIELASTKTTHAPGWAYVPDTPATAIPSQSVSAVHLHVNRNKRAARQANAAAGSSSAAAHHNDISARHDAKLQKEIDQLQRDTLGGAAAAVPIPSSGRDRDGKVRGHTPNVRKILVSQKTFANHLDDFEAWSRTQGQGDSSAGQSLAGTPAPALPAAAAVSGGGGNKKTTAAAAAATTTQKKGVSRSRAASGNKKSAAAAAPDPDVTMTDAHAPAPAEEEKPPSSAALEEASSLSSSRILTPFTRFELPAHPGDADPLLESWLPPLPTDAELRELMRAPPLNYNQARGAWADDDGDGGSTRYPARQFCEVCGYWGRVRCMKCGTRVCALDCLDVHREECITRYGL